MIEWMKRLPIIKRLKTIDQLGVIYGMISSLIGSLLFGTANTFIEYNILANYWIRGVLELSLYAFILSIIPSAIFGLFLARKIHKDLAKSKTSAFRPTLRGFFVGFIFAILFSVGVYEYFYPEITYHALPVLIQFSFIALIVTPIVCGGASYHLHQRLRNEVEGEVGKPLPHEVL